MRGVEGVMIVVNELEREDVVDVLDGVRKVDSEGRGGVVLGCIIMVGTTAQGAGGKARGVGGEADTCMIK